MTAPRADGPANLPDRFDVERAAEESDLTKCERDIVFCLARRMDIGTTVIPRKFSPSLTRLAAVTGWSRRQIQRSLAVLERREVITRIRPAVVDARRKHARTVYTVHYDRLTAIRARDKETSGLGTPRPVPRDKESPELGTDRPEARDTVAPSQISPDHPDHSPDPAIAVVIRTLEARTAKTVSEEWAEKTRDLILARPGAPSGRRAVGYIRRVLMTDTNPGRWLPTPQPPPYQPEE